jgi:hypothetical protein
MNCPTHEQLFEAVRSGDGSMDDHLPGCASCRSLFDSHKIIADELRMAGLRQSVLDLVPKPTRRVRRPAPQRPSIVGWVVGAAAAVLVAALLLFSLATEKAPAPTVWKPTLPVVEPKKDEPKPVVVEPKKEEPKPVVVQPKKEEPRKEEAPIVVPTPPREEPKTVVVEPKKEEPKPVVEPPKKTEIEPVKYKPVVVTAVYGPVARRTGERLAAGAPLARTDQVVTNSRQPGRLVVGKDYVVSLDRSTSFQVEQQEAGETRVTLSGRAFFEVEKRTTPFVIKTPHAEAIVVGTSFQVETDDKRTTLHVLEGSVRLKNDKGEALVKASQRSTATAGAKPSSPVRLDVEAETAWRARPDLSGNPAKEPFFDHSPGGNRKLAGVVLESPYHETEVDSGRLARATADLMDLGLALGHFHRSREKKIWLNVDRGTEGEFRPDGSLGAAVVTDRAKKVTAEYLGHLRAAAGTAPNQPIPMIVNFRDHSEVQDGAELEICEVAWSGWQKKTIEQAKVFYGQLLDKHKPAYRVEMRFDQVDDSYDYKGKKRKFMFTESDAKPDGYMAPRHSQRAIAFFFNPSFGGRPEDIDAYARILAELIEFLYARPR